jgi:hypothetical protein
MRTRRHDSPSSVCIVINLCPPYITMCGLDALVWPPSGRRVNIARNVPLVFESRAELTLTGSRYVRAEEFAMATSNV